MLYLFIVILILVGTVIFDIIGFRKGRLDYFWFIVILLIIMSGFAYRLGGDGYVYYREYGTYVDIFHLDARYLDKYSSIRLPGWMILSSITKTFVTDYWFFKLVHAIIVNGLFAYGLCKCTRYIFTALLFYFVLIYFNFNFQVLRESVAIGIFMYSLQFYFSKKWLKYYLCCVLALTFHESSLFSLMLPAFSLWDRGKNYKYVYVFMLMALLLFANSIREYILYITPALGMFTDRVSTYAQEFNQEYEFSNYGNFIFNVILPLFVVLYLEKHNVLLKYKHLVLAATFTYTLSLFIPIAYRFVNYYLIFSYLTVIIFIDRLILPQHKLHPLAFIVCCSIFILFKARMYLGTYGETNVPSYHQYYPYASIFERSIDPERELILRDSY